MFFLINPCYDKYQMNRFSPNLIFNMVALVETSHLKSLEHAKEASGPKIYVFQSGGDGKGVKL